MKNKKSDMIHYKSCTFEKDIIPNTSAPDNNIFFGERSNPLSSKGEIGGFTDYDDYEMQARKTSMKREK